MGLLGFLVRASIAALATAAVISIVVAFLDSTVLRQKVMEKSPNAFKAVIKSVVHNDSVAHVSLDAISEDGVCDTIEIQADDIDYSEIYEGNEIYI